MACPSGMTAIAPALAMLLVDRVFRIHVASGAECRLHGMSLRRLLTLAIRAMGNWSPRQARLSTRPSQICNTPRRGCIITIAAGGLRF
jgi:hypothetical protein